MKVLVTGGAGYVGSFMTKALLMQSYEVIVIDNLQRGAKEAVDSKAEFIKGDILDKSFLKEFFSQHKVDTILHFAGLISMEESVKKPYLYFENNSLGSLNLIEAAVASGIKKFIFSSTAGVYGNPTKIPIPENHPTIPTNPYGESKLIVEKILSWYHEVYNLSFASLRYFNAAGASLDGKLGEKHDPETHIIPLAMKAALKNKEFYLYGTDYPTNDGTCIRDYIHVLDLVESHIQALSLLEKKKGEFFYNVGTGAGFSNREVIEMVKRVSKVDFKVVEKDRRPGDAKILIADSTKIIKELGFSPKYSDLETIVKTAWNWHKSQFKI